MDDGLTPRQRAIIEQARALLLASGVPEDDLFFPDALPLETESNDGHWVKVEIFIPNREP